MSGSQLIESSARKNLKNICIYGLLSGAAVLGLSTGAQAQVVAGEENVIIVTAQKKEQDLQDVGIAVTAFSGEQLEALNLDDTTGIVLQTPSLQVYEFSPSITVYNIRGVSQNSFSDNLEGPVAVYIDDAYISPLGAQNQPIYDVERVEVLKGPQGTLYGRNATAGLIHYISRKPTDQFEGRLSATYGSFDLVNIEGAISGPITDGLRARVAGTYTSEDGYLESLNPNVRDAYGDNTFALKAFIEADIGGTGTLTINPFYSKSTDVPTGAYVRIEAAQDPATGLGVALAPPADPFVHDSDTQGRFDREIWGLTGKLDVELTDSLDLTWISNYFEMDKYYYEDSEGRNLTVNDIIGFGPAFADFNPLGVFAFATNQEFKQFTQEVRLAGEADTFNWQVGAYYLTLQQENFAVVEGLAALFTNPDTFNPGAGTGFTSQARNDFTLDSESYSIFAQGEFDLTDDLRLIVGGRVVRDERLFDAFIRYQEVDPTLSDLASGVGGANPPVIDVLEVADPGDFPGAPQAVLESFAPICYSVIADVRCANDVADPEADFGYTDWAAKVQLDYRVNDDVLVYFGVNRGTRGGNFATPSFPDSVRANGLASLSHTEETLWSFEGGFKATIFDGDGRFNAAAFYYDYDDYQAFSLTNFVQNISNNDARVLGLEFDFAASPVAGLDLVLGGSFLDTKVEDIVTPNGTLIDTELPNAPSVSLNGLIRYAIYFGDSELSFQVDGNFNGSQFLEVTNPASSLEGSYFVGNASIGFAPTESIRLTAWVKNFTDQEYRVYSLDVAGAPAPFINDVFAKPRTFGVTANVNF